MIKFCKHYLTNGAIKARVWYALDNRIDGRKVVTIYAKDYSDALGKLGLEGYENDMDMQTDYFEKGRVRLFETHPLYAQARTHVEAMQAKVAS